MLLGCNPGLPLLDDNPGLSLLGESGTDGFLPPLRAAEVQGVTIAELHKLVDRRMLSAKPSLTSTSRKRCELRYLAGSPWR